MASRFLGQLTLGRSYPGLGFEANLPWEELYWGVKLGFECDLTHLTVVEKAAGYESKIRGRGLC